MYCQSFRYTTRWRPPFNIQSRIQRWWWYRGKGSEWIQQSGGGGGVVGKSERDKRMANRRSRTAVTPQLCSADPCVTRLYNPISLLCFITEKCQHVGLPASRPPPLHARFKRHQFCTRDFLTGLCRLTPASLTRFSGLWVCMVPVGARQAMAVPPARRHVPGPGLTSPPLLPSGLPWSVADLVREKEASAAFYGKDLPGRTSPRTDKAVCVLQRRQTMYVWGEECWQRGSFLYPKIN